MRVVIGFALRLIASTVISVAVWWLMVTPFDRLHLPSPVVFGIVRIFDFPVAVAGEVLPIRGVELVFDDHDTWCDFCTADERFYQQLRIAIPTYLFLLYLPTLLRWMARRNRRLFQRVAVGLLIYAAFTTAFFPLIGDGDRKDDVRIAAMWLLILAVAAAVAWSRIAPRWKNYAIAAVLLVGAGAMQFVLISIAPKMYDAQPYPKVDAAQLHFVSYLLLLILGVGGTLSLTRAVESGIERWQRSPVDA